MPKRDRIEEWRDEGVLDERISLMRSLSMQGFSLEKIGEHDEIQLSKRQINRLMKKYADIMAPIKQGREYVVAFAQSALMQQIEAGNTAAIIYALKVYGGEFFKENKLEFKLQKNEFEFRKQQLGALGNEENRTIVFNIRPAADLTTKNADDTVCEG